MVEAGGSLHQQVPQAAGLTLPSAGTAAVAVPHTLPYHSCQAVGTAADRTAGTGTLPVHRSRLPGIVLDHTALESTGTEHSTAAGTGCTAAGYTAADCTAGSAGCSVLLLLAALEAA